MQKLSPENAVSRWENEGGSLLRAPGAPDGDAPPPCFPSLPAGCLAQPVWGFTDPTGDLLYEFHHVYRPVERLIARVPTLINRLDEDLSFWLLTWSTLNKSGDARPSGRWINYAQVRKLPGPRLTFKQFSQLREPLAALLHTGNGG